MLPNNTKAFSKHIVSFGAAKRKRNTRSTLAVIFIHFFKEDDIMAKAKKLPSGSWRCLVYDYTDINGKRKYISFTDDDPTPAGRRRCEMKAAEYAATKEKCNKSSKSLTVTEAIDKYIEKYPQLSETTIAGYRTTQQYGFQCLMNKKLSSLNNDILQEAINKECKRPSQSRKSKGKPIGAKTIKNEFGLISTVIHEFYPFEINVKLPQASTRVNEISMPDVIFNVVKGTDIELPVLLAMWLSFTMSEIRGLTKSGSIKGNCLYVDQVTISVNGKDIDKSIAKNKKRNRMLVIPEYIKGLIDEVETDRLVTMSGKAVSNKFSYLLKKNGIPHMSFHDLRHVSASVMAMLNVPDKYAQDRGGWETDKIMKSTYMQTFKTARTEIDNKIDNYFNESLFGNKKDSELKKKYDCWLTLFEKEDTPESKEEFQKFLSMQHEMQHVK